jgi:acetyl-CoA synthetase
MKSPSIEQVFQENRIIEIRGKNNLKCYIKNNKEYIKIYNESIDEIDKFWGETAREFKWYRPWDKVLSSQWGDSAAVQWFEGAQTNMSDNCLDRHLDSLGDKTAILWEGNEPGETRAITYRQLHEEVGRLANGLKALGVKKGDRVAVYLGMVPELAFALLACARIGAVHNVIFGGFSAESLKDRILDCRADFLLTADGLFRGKKTVSLKANADLAMEWCEAEGHPVKACLVLKRTGEELVMKPGRDFAWEECIASQAAECPPEVMDAEDPLFILYTSGSTGKPKGVLHTTAGYMVYVATTFKYVFAYRPGDIFWCTADIGWITGHSYVVYGPLLNGATTLMFEGIPTYPKPDRFWEMIERHGVNIFYTAPTAIRSLMREPDQWVKRHNLDSLKLLGTVGEPINPETWMWYFEKIGQGQCPIVDTWWQTETGGIMVTTLPGAMPMKPSAAGVPFFGVQPKVVREDGTECTAEEGGYFVIEAPWPAMSRGVYGQPERLKQTYFSRFPGKYFSGDGARRDKDGYFWFMGRLDDILKVSGHRLGTAELESAFVKHPKVVEAAVVGYPHAVKGEGIYAFVTLKDGVAGDRMLRRELIQHIAREIGPIAKPDHIQFTPDLPKTRSGKIMRRILRKIAQGDVSNLGDTSTLADPEVVSRLLEGAVTAEE